jgi:hypothetical protein
MALRNQLLKSGLDEKNKGRFVYCFIVLHHMFIQLTIICTNSLSSVEAHLQYFFIAARFEGPPQDAWPRFEPRTAFHLTQNGLPSVQPTNHLSAPHPAI